MTASDIHSLSGAYALDAVDDLERAAFERHLRECEACALEVGELRETVSRLLPEAFRAFSEYERRVLGLERREAAS